MSALLGQLRQLHDDLARIARDDAEQEVMGLALPLMDAVLSEARAELPQGSGLATQIVDLVSPEQIEAGEGIRAVDASIVVGQLLAVMTTMTKEREARAAEILAADAALLPRFLKLLPPDGRAIRFLRDHDFVMQFEHEAVFPLWDYRDSWTSPSQRFHSPRLAPLDAEFREQIGALSDHAVKHVFTVRGSESRRVHPDFDLDLITDENRFVFDAIEQGNKVLTRAHAAYEALLRECDLVLPRATS